jgi:hypothetical protein
VAPKLTDGQTQEVRDPFGGVEPGGIARGKVVGQSDAQGGDVKDTPVSPKDILATAFHLLGIDPSTTINDRQSRPHRVAGEGEVRPELLG